MPSKRIPGFSLRIYKKEVVDGQWDGPEEPECQGKEEKLNVQVPSVCPPLYLAFQGIC